MAELALLILVFVALSGLLALLDAAIISVNHAEVEDMMARNLWGSAQLKWVIRHLMRAVIVIVILTNAINILGPTIIGVRTAFLFGNQTLGILTAILTALTILFSEIIPKALGTRHAPAIARYSAPALHAVILVLLPVVLFIEMLVKPLRQGDRPVGTEDQIRALVRIGARRGLIEEDEQRLITRTFVLNDRTAGHIMIPREKVVWMPHAVTMREAGTIAADSHHHRYPVFGPGEDEVRGFVMTRDILQAVMDGEGGKPVTDFLHEPVVVADTMRADLLLELFRKTRLHLAIVRDTRGKVLGIVTLQDVLEELVGEMEGERRIEE